MVFFSAAAFVTLFALQRLQWFLPFNPPGQADTAAMAIESERNITAEAVTEAHERHVEHGTR